MRMIGAHDPGGFIVKITVDVLVANKVLLVTDGIVYGGFIPIPLQEYGPRPGGAIIVAPLAPQVGKVIDAVPAGN